MPKKKISLRSFISREFIKAALLPLLVIEVALLALYFFMNTYLIDKSTQTLTDQYLSYLLETTDNQARIISEQLHSVADLTLFLQADTARFYHHPEQYPVHESDQLFGFAENGVYYKLKDNGGSSLFYSTKTSIGHDEKEKALLSEALDPLYKEIFLSNGNIVAVYLNTHDSMCRYYPFFENMYDQLPPDMDISTYNFYYLADDAHNPGGGPVWTEAYLDPMGAGWMMSCIAPIYKGDFLEGVAGIDITIRIFIDSLLGLRLPWGAQAFLVDAEGTIMAMPPEVERLFGLTELLHVRYKDKVKQDTHKPEAFNLLDSVLSTLREPLSGLMQQESGFVEVPLDGRRLVLCLNTVAETGWKFMVIVDRAAILSPISDLEQHARHVGYAAIGFMCLFYAVFLLYLIANTRRMAGRIAEPIDDLSNAIQRLGTGIYQTKLKKGPVTELNTLSSNFESMAQDLQALHRNLEDEVENANMAKNEAKKAEEMLKEHKSKLEKTVEERTLDLRKANDSLQEDIIKRKQIENELNIERQQLLSIFDSIDEPVHVSSPDTYELLYVNEAFKKLWPDSEGKKCYEVIHHLNAPCSFCTSDHIFGEENGKPYIWEHYNESVDRWFRCIDKAIQWPDSQEVRYEMAIDITHQKRASEEKERLLSRLRRAEKMEALGTLAGGVAHDLNNVLGGIVGYPDLLLMDMPGDSPLRKPIQTIQMSGQRAAAIVQDLLTLSRQGVSVMEATQLNDVVAGYLGSPEHERLVSGHHPGIRLTTRFSEDLLSCMGSPVHLSKMVMNLVSNSAEAMPDGGTISISTYNQYIDRPLKGYDEVHEGDYVVLRIQDDGIGIPEADLERIFEPFYTKKKMGRSGTGLGMAVVWGTVKDHRGYIELKSAPEQGTTVEIYLPATRDLSVEGKQEQRLDEHTGNGETVLVVDDVEIQREIAVGMLRRLGYHAIAVPSGEEAVAHLERNSVDLVLLDMIMEPHMDGLETYRRILRIHPGQKAIIVSGFSETAAIRETLRLGAGGYMKKPYTANELGRLIKEELSKTGTP